MADEKKIDWAKLEKQRMADVAGATERIHRNLNLYDPKVSNPDAFVNYVDPKNPKDVASVRIGNATRAVGLHAMPYKDEILSYATQKKVNPMLAMAILAVEQQGNTERGNYGTKSEKGASGLMQLMPETAKQMGVDPSDPVQSIRGAIDTIAEMQNRLGTQDPYFLAAAYNASDKKIRDYAQSINELPLETRKFLAAFHPAYLTALESMGKVSP